MIFKCISTGSIGNCYVLDDGKDIILLDAGIPMKNIKIGINFEVSRLKAAFFSHGHSDHSYSVKDLENMGKVVIKPYEVPIFETVKIGNFSVKAFELTDLEGNPTHTNADGSPCRVFGYHITHPDIGKMIYITDTQFIKYQFKNIDTVLLGVNYSTEMFAEDEDDGKKYHVIGGHLDINTAKEFIKVTDNNSNLANVFLCHLSASNSDKDTFRNEIQEVTSAVVRIMKKGDVFGWAN